MKNLDNMISSKINYYNKIIKTVKFGKRHIKKLLQEMFEKS